MNDRAFTLVETLISLFVLSIAVTGIFTVISFNLSSATGIRNSFTASGLAQEGMEIVRNLRDTDWHNGRAFGSFGNSSGPVADGTYRVQWDSSVLSALDPSQFLAKDSGGLYGYGSGTPTIFQRTVKIETVTASTNIRVTVTVSWNDRWGTKTINAEEYLYNWF